MNFFRWLWAWVLFLFLTVGVSWLFVTALRPV